MNFLSLSPQRSQLYSDYAANCKMKTASDHCRYLALAPDFGGSNIPTPQRKERSKGCLPETRAQRAVSSQGEILGAVQAAATLLPKQFKGCELGSMPGLLPWVGHLCGASVGYGVCERYRETFLVRIALGC